MDQRVMMTDIDNNYTSIYLAWTGRFFCLFGLFMRSGFFEAERRHLLHIKFYLDGTSVDTDW